MKTVRPGTFETNSSSTHAMCMCTQENYDKFQNMELFLHDEVLETAEELYAQFIAPFSGEPSTWSSWALDTFTQDFGGKIPTFDTFKVALKGKNEWHYVNDDDRDAYSDEDWVIAKIRESFISRSIGNISNFYKNDGYYYERFYDSLNGVVAFGYYGAQ